MTERQRRQIKRTVRSLNQRTAAYHAFVGTVPLSATERRRRRSDRTDRFVIESSERDWQTGFRTTVHTVTKESYL